MLESQGDRSLDAAEDAGRPVAFVQSPSALPMVLSPVSGRIGGPMQLTGQANARTARDQA